MIHRRVAAPLIIAMAVVSGAAHAELRVGSKRFTESYILGEIVRHAAERAHETKIVHRQGLGNTGITFAALQAGEIDMYPEYTGTLARELLKLPADASPERIRSELARQNLDMAIAFGFNNSYALAARRAWTHERNVVRLSDLARTPNARLGLTQEFLGRDDGWTGLLRRYDLALGAPRGMDHALAYDAIAHGELDLTDVYTTDAKIPKFDLVVLEDDQHYFARYDAVLVHRRDVAERFPKTWAALRELEHAIDEATMARLNSEAENEGRSFSAIAARFLGDGAVQAERSMGSLLFGPDFWPLTLQHAGLVFGALLLSLIAAIPLGVMSASRPWVARTVLGFAAIVQTIPSLALLGFLIGMLQRIGAVPALVALFLYGLLPIVRNTYAGLQQIAPSLRESASVLGLSRWAQLRLVELPLAIPTIFAGIKTAAVVNVGTATIAAFIGAGGYGERIATGLALNDRMVLLSGAIPSAAMALAVQFVFDALEKWLTPRGLRLAATNR